jgi:hypothetical protein
LERQGADTHGMHEIGGSADHRLPITDFAHKAAVIGDAAVAAVLAALDMATQRGGAAGLDRRHHLDLGQAHMAGMRRAPGWSMNSEDIGDLERRSHPDQPELAPSISSLMCSSGLVTARIVLVATRA